MMTRNASEIHVYERVKVLTETITADCKTQENVKPEVPAQESLRTPKKPENE